MATENNNKNLNVPNLRFPEFHKPYSSTTISKLATIVGGGTPDTTVPDYWNGGIQWFTPSEIGKNKYTNKSERTISQEGLNNSSAKLLPINTILLSTRATIGESSIAKAECCTNQGFQSLIANEEIVCYEYLYYLVATLKKELIRKSCGSTFLEISANEVRKIKTFVPSLEEQGKVSSLLSLIDERIATQIKIIEKLESLIKGLCQKLFRFDECTTYFLGDICSITTGKLDANAMVENGKYPFFTCAEEVFNIDNYAFDTEALLISGNGANLGYIHYYNGKFNAYQRTYVLDKFTIDINYIRLYLETFLKNRIEQEKNIGNTPYIVLGTLSKMKIKVPNILTQQKIVKTLTSFKNKLSNERLALKKYEEQKKYLLSNLFI